MEGRGRCGPSAKLRDTGQLALPTAGSERPQGRKARCLSPGLLIQTALSAGRNTRRIQKQAQGRRREEKPPPRGHLQSQLCSPALVPEGPPHRRLCHEKQFGVTSREDHKIFQDTFVSHTSLKQQHGGFRGKAWGQYGRGAGRAPEGRAGPLQDVPNAGLEAAARCHREGLAGDLLPVRERGVGSSGQRGRQGRVRQAQFCWWGAWAPWVLRADEG